MLGTAVYIGKRYASLRSSNQLVSFISLLSVCGLGLGVAILTTVLSVMNGFDRELQQRILGLVPHITVTSVRNASLKDVQGWEALRESIHTVPGITGSAPYLQLQGMLLAKGRSKGIVLNGIMPDEETRVSILEDFITQGSLAGLNDRSYGIVLGQSLARYLGVSLGEQVMLVSTVAPISPMGEFTRQKFFTVTGIFNVGSSIDGNLAMVHMQDAQRLYRLGDKIHGYRLQTDDLFGVHAIEEVLTSILPGDLAIADWTLAYGNIYENIRISKALVGLLLTLLVAVAAYNIVVSLMMVVKDKQGDIAILRTMGASLGTIRRIFLVQGFLIGLAGALGGLGLGVLLSRLAGTAVSWLESLLGIQLLSADVYPVNYLPSELRLDDFLLVGILALSLTLLATLYPASRAAQTNPAEILRHE
jgi:lipoprotein-releasing system permease protein